LGAKLPNTFSEKERIVRFIYSEKNINPRTNKLKSNFVQFRPNPQTDKMELSCLRFELENLNNCRILGRANEDTTHDRAYFGVGCTEVSHIGELSNYSIAFTPFLTSNPKNYFHTDIYDNQMTPTQIGVANPADVNFRKEEFKGIWESYKDDQILSKKTVQPLRK
jgi:hypothetical protein